MSKEQERQELEEPFQNVWQVAEGESRKDSWKYCERQVGFVGRLQKHHSMAWDSPHDAKRSKGKDRLAGLQLQHGATKWGKLEVGFP